MTVANQPSWIPGAINGLPVVRFNGSNGFVNLPGFLTGMPQAEVFVVLKVAATNATHGLWTFGGSGLSWNEEYTAPGGYIQEDFGSTSYYNLGTPAQPTTQYHIYQVSAQTNNWAAWMNGSLLYQTFQNSVKFDTEGAPIIGQNNSHFLGDIAEVMIFNRALTSDERDTVGGYLKTKYALSQYAVNSSPPATPTNFVAVGIAPNQLELEWMPAFYERLQLSCRTGTRNKWPVSRNWRVFWLCNKFCRHDSFTRNHELLSR